jgi:AhpC/TSA antioxidant enzyme
MHLVKVLEGHDRLTESAAVLAVACDLPQRVRDTMLRGLDVPFPVLADPRRESYREWGLARMPRRRVVSAANLGGYARMLLAGERLRAPGEDPRQLGGDFVVAPSGIVAYAHPQADAHDRPPVGVLLRELERAARLPGPNTL